MILKTFFHFALLNYEKLQSNESWLRIFKLNTIAPALLDGKVLKKVEEKKSELRLTKRISFCPILKTFSWVCCLNIVAVQYFFHVQVTDFDDMKMAWREEANTTAEALDSLGKASWDESTFWPLNFTFYEVWVGQRLSARLKLKWTRRSETEVGYLQKIASYRREWSSPESTILRSYVYIVCLIVSCRKSEFHAAEISRNFKSLGMTI